jgi:membrane associated rhomboid family serine protease
MGAVMPLQSEYKVNSVPWVTVGLIVVNVIVFLYELTLGDAVEAFFYAYATVPCQVTTSCAVTQANPYLTLITSQFMHGGWLHLIGNMAYLWVFGQNVEDLFGPIHYLVFYLVCGVMASLAQVAIDPQSSVPNLGASGAIAGVLGAYLVLFPLASIRTAVWFGPFVTLPSIPAFVLIGGWFLMQFASGVGSLGASAEQGGVAYWAHIGGFVFGAGWAWVWRTVSPGTVYARQP